MTPISVYCLSFNGHAGAEDSSDVIIVSLALAEISFIASSPVRFLKFQFFLIGSPSTRAAWGCTNAQGPVLRRAVTFSILVWTPQTVLLVWAMERSLGNIILLYLQKWHLSLHYKELDQDNCLPGKAIERGVDPERPDF